MQAVAASRVISMIHIATEINPQVLPPFVYGSTETRNCYSKAPPSPHTMRPRLIDVNTEQFADPREVWPAGQKRERVPEDWRKKRKEKPNDPKNEQKAQYGILSHRWLADEHEVKFHDIGQPEASEKDGNFKITETCKLAKKDGLKYIWLDTCCIDKTNSAELQGSINSMYRWYEEAAVCYVYLQDTDSQPVPPAIFKGTQDDEWYERGWTLQELVAPKRVEFYDKKWRHLGSKLDLKYEIHERTGISLALLANEAELHEFSIAERLSWAANRTTTVVEDRAYSLFGMFDVNLPMLYGEGEKAFIRLQEEIIKTSDDHSIFAWKGVGGCHSGLLATNPECFAECGSVKSVRMRKGRSAYQVTNRGVQITLNLTPWLLDTYLARVHCNDMAAKESPSMNRMAGIFLQRLEEDDQYVRIEVDGKDVINNVRPPPNWQSTQWDDLCRDIPVYVRQSQKSSVKQPAAATAGIFGYRLGDGLIEYGSKGERLFTFHGPRGAAAWNDATKMVTIPRGTGSKGWISTLDISKQGKKIKQIKLCFDFGFNPVLFLADSGAIGREERAFNKMGQFNIGSEWQFSQEEMHAAKALSERSPHDQMGWSNVSVHGEKTVAFEVVHRSGLWALKGDRITGIDTYLSDTSDKNIRVILKKGISEYGPVWDLQIENMPRKGIRKFIK